MVFGIAAHPIPRRVPVERMRFNAIMVIVKHQQVAAGAGCGWAFGFQTVCACNMFCGREDVFLLTNLGKTLGMVWRSEFGPPS